MENKLNGVFYSLTNGWLMENMEFVGGGVGGRPDKFSFVLISSICQNKKK